MTVYAKLTNAPGISATYEDAAGNDQNVYIPGNGVVTAIDPAAAALPGIAHAITAGTLVLYSDSAGTQVISVAQATGSAGPATTSVAGLVKLGAAVPNSTATGTDVPTLTANFNALLASLRAAGIIHT